MISKKYNQIIKAYGFEDDYDAKGVLLTICNCISTFVKKHSNIALYCNGQHTQSLMADFISELRNVRFIVDNHPLVMDDSGFIIIKDDEIEKYRIDGIIISSYKYRNSVKESLCRKHIGLAYLDIYEELEKSGKKIHNEYYRYNHPFQHYRIINEIQNLISIEKEANVRKKLYHSLIGEYLKIKDIRMAYIKAQEAGDEHLSQELLELYHAELDEAMRISKDHVLMFCADGLRKRDFNSDNMPLLSKYVNDKACEYTNAYAYSTSTFESLVPAYGNNNDQRTKYYLNDYVMGDKCDFIKEAKKQGRDIYFYTDANELVRDESIHRYEDYQTLTEKIWTFINDAAKSKKGLFYIHSSYETHFSFANPYTSGYMIAEGTGLLLDYMPEKGGSLRTDYEKQHYEALKYYDDSVAPFFERFTFSIIFFADHGNVILNKHVKLNEIGVAELVAGDDLITIPLVVVSKVYPVTRDARLMSLMDINDIVIALMQERYVDLGGHREYIKIGRSEIYNPNYKYLYKQVGQEHSLLAFEGFIFENGKKLIIYSDGKVELYSTGTEELVDDQDEKNLLFEIIKKEVSVTDFIYRGNSEN